MLGGERKKAQKLLTTCPSLAALAKECDNSHEHKQWQPLFQEGKFMGFATHLEAEYPDLFCSEYARATEALIACDRGDAAAAVGASVDQEKLDLLRRKLKRLHRAW